MSEHEEKEVHWYSATVNAWFSTRLEHDRSLLALSAGAIGLLVTLLSTVGVWSAEGALLFGAALLAFFVSLVAVLWIFRRNATHLTETIKSNVASDPVLRALDVIAIGAFLFGVVLASIIGVSAAVHSLKPSEVGMSDEQKIQSQIGNDSFNGATSMRPQGDLVKKSFEGAMALRPAPAAAPIQQEPVSAPSEPVPSNTGEGS